MKIVDMNWMQVEAYLHRDDRAVIPLGSTEQHAYLSLGTDGILSERVAVEAAEPLGVPVFPVLWYGITPGFLAFPGTVSLKTATYLSVICDILDSLHGQGFRRFALVNGHGGNSPVSSLAVEWMAANSGTKVVVHNWWSAQRTVAAVQSIDSNASHGSWMENFPWNRVAASPGGAKSPVDLEVLRSSSPGGVKDLLGDGNYGGAYEKPDHDMMTVWEAGVEETRAVINGL